MQSQITNTLKATVISSFLFFPGGSEVKASASNVGDSGSIPGLGRSPGEGNGNPLQYSCLENPMDEGFWQATVHGITKDQTERLNNTQNDKIIRSFDSFTSEASLFIIFAF